MEKNRLFSIIIPVYNPRNSFFQLLSQLLELGRNYNLEIIVIDDGSNYMDMIEMNKYMKKGIVYKRFRNGGVSAARNRGINLSHGDYLMFFDADDLIDIKVLSGIMDRILSADPSIDVFMFAYSVIFGEKREDMIPCLNIGLHYKEDINKLKRSLVDVKFSKRYNPSYMGGKVYQYIVRRNLFFEGGLCFYEGQEFAEDLCYCMMMFDLAKSIYVFHDTAYLYYVNEGSASHKYRPNLWNEWYSVYKYIDKYIDNNVIKNRLIYWAAKYSIRHIVAHENDNIIRKQKVSDIIRNTELQSAMGKLDFDRWSFCERIEKRLIIFGNTRMLVVFEILIFNLKTCGKSVKEWTWLKKKKESAS